MVVWGETCCLARTSSYLFGIWCEIWCEHRLPPGCYYGSIWLPEGFIFDTCRQTWLATFEWSLSADPVIHKQSVFGILYNLFGIGGSFCVIWRQWKLTWSIVRSRLLLPHTVVNRFMPYPSLHAVYILIASPSVSQCMIIDWGLTFASYTHAAAPLKLTPAVRMPLSAIELPVESPYIRSWRTSSPGRLCPLASHSPRVGKTRQQTTWRSDSMAAQQTFDMGWHSMAHPCGFLCERGGFLKERVPTKSWKRLTRVAAFVQHH